MPLPPTCPLDNLPDLRYNSSHCEALCAEVWPGPWSIEHTAEEKIETQLFDGDQAGLDKAVAWLHERYTAEADRWTDIPSILDCEPDR